MTRPRTEQIIAGEPGFYHCISRCVRRAWLCGIDPLSGRDYNHRRDWVVDRMTQLTALFAIDVYAYAIISNHSHIVLFVDPHRIDELTDEEVIRRWKTALNWRHPEKPVPIPKVVAPEQIKVWRERLASVSWFMRLLNEPIWSHPASFLAVDGAAYVYAST